MAIKFTIGGVDRTTLVRADSLSIIDRLNSRNTAKFEMVSTDGSYRPTIGAEVVVTNMALTSPSSVVPTFTRNSVAWMFGVSYPVNTPRYPSQSGTVGVMVEQGATNLLNANNASFETDVGGVALTGVTLAAGATKAHSSTNPYTGTYCAAISVTAQNQGARVDATGSFAAGGSYVVSGYLNVPAGQTLQVYAVDITNGVVSAATPVTGTGAYQRVEATVTVGASTSTAISLQARANAAAPNFTFRMDALQVETGTEATSWHLPGTARGPETLTVSTVGLLTPQAGSVNIRFYVDGDLTSGLTPRVLFDTGAAVGSNRLYLARVTNGAWRAALVSSGGSTTVADWSGTLSVGFHNAAIVWSASRLSIYIDGVERGFALTPNRPSALGTLGYIGSNIVGGEQVGRIIPAVTLYTRDLSAAEVVALAAGSPPSDFTAHVDFTSGAPVVTKGGRAIFAGFIDEYEEEKLTGSPALALTLDLVDYNAIADQRRVAKAYEVPGQTLSDVVNDIVTHFLDGEGITTTNVQTGPIIEKAIWNYQTVAEAFNDLADLTGYIWYIDYNKDLHFVSRDTNAAPFGLTDSSDNFREMRVKRTREQYRNRQIIRAGTDLTDPRTETFKGDGEARVWPLAFPIGAVPSAITVNGVPKTLGIKGVDTGKDFYWNKGEAQITQDDSATKLTASDIGAITYQGEYPLMLTAQDDSQVAERRAVEGGTGLHEHLEDFPNVNSSAQAEQGAQGLLQKFGRIPRIVHFETDDAGLSAGQLLPVTNTAHDLSGSYLIESVELGDFGAADERLRYRVKALDGANLGGWEEFFRALARMGRRFIIRENEVVVTLRQLSETITVSDSVTYTSAAPESRADYALADFSEAA